MPKKVIVEKKVDKVVESEKVSIPVVKFDDEVSVKKHGRVVDRFRRKEKTVSTPKVKDRPVIEIDEETKENFIIFAATKELLETFEDEKKTLTGSLYDSIFSQYKEVLWNSKTQPKNPAIKVEKDGLLEAEGQFIVQVGSKIKINLPPVGEDEMPEDVMLKSLVDLGVSEENARRLIEKEVSFAPKWTLNFTDMLYGSMTDGKIVPATEKQVAASEILFQVMNNEDEEGNPLNFKSRIEMLKKITEEGWDLLNQNIKENTKYYPQLTDGAGFLDRVCSYANTFRDLDAILTVFQPVHFCQRVKFACSDPADVRLSRLISEADRIVTKKFKEKMDD
jgi:hypothetical protein